MKIESVADLAKLADMCRKKGIKQVKITQDCVEFQLGDKPGPKVRMSKGSDKVDEKQLTEEEMLYWSSAGVGGAQ